MLGVYRVKISHIREEEKRGLLCPLLQKDEVAQKSVDDQLVGGMTR